MEDTLIIATDNIKNMFGSNIKLMYLAAIGSRETGISGDLSDYDYTGVYLSESPGHGILKMSFDTDCRNEITLLDIRDIHIQCLRTHYTQMFYSSNFYCSPEFEKALSLSNLYISTHRMELYDELFIWIDDLDNRNRLSENKAIYISLLNVCRLYFFQSSGYSSFNEIFKYENLIDTLIAVKENKYDLAKAQNILNETLENFPKPNEVHKNTFFYKECQKIYEL